MKNTKVAALMQTVQERHLLACIYHLTQAVNLLAEAQDDKDYNKWLYETEDVLDDIEHYARTLPNGKHLMAVVNRARR